MFRSHKTVFKRRFTYVFTLKMHIFIQSLKIHEMEKFLKGNYVIWLFNHFLKIIYSF